MELHYLNVCCLGKKMKLLSHQQKNVSLVQAVFHVENYYILFVSLLFLSWNLSFGQQCTVVR